jgi:hypothetical protein
MEPEKVEHQATFETYKLLADLPVTVQDKLLQKTVAIVGKKKEFAFFDPENRLFGSLQPDVEFAPEEINIRRPWKVEIEQRKIGKPKRFLVYSDDDAKSLKVKSQQMLVAGPNNNNICVVDDEVIQLANKQEIESKPRLLDRFKNLRKDRHKLPGDLLVIHPYQNICLINTLQAHKKQTIKELCSYNLDTRELGVIANYDDLLQGSALVDFGPENTILLINAGILFMYSLDEKHIKAVIYDNQYVPRSKFDALLGVNENGDDDFKRFKLCTSLKGNQSFYIDEFHFSFDHPELILLSFNLHFLGEDGEMEHNTGCGLFNTVNKRIMCGLTEDAHFPFWQNSIKTYNQSDPRNLLPAQRDVVSMISWDMNDLNACLLIRIAHNWLQNKEPNRDEARSILSTLYHSENKWKFLLKSTIYIPELNLRINPFKDIFYAIKRPEHTHVTEVI